MLQKISIFTKEKLLHSVLSSELIGRILHTLNAVHCDSYSHLTRYIVDRLILVVLILLLSAIVACRIVGIGVVGSVCVVFAVNSEKLVGFCNCLFSKLVSKLGVLLLDFKIGHGITA